MTTSQDTTFNETDADTGMDIADLGKDLCDVLALLEGVKLTLGEIELLPYPPGVDIAKSLNFMALDKIRTLRETVSNATHL